MAKDYYQILGVSKSASQDEVRKAYYKLAHQHHPNKGGDEAKMKEINEAYGVIGNEDKRKQYDQFGQTFDQAGGSGGFGGFNGQGFGQQGFNGGQSFNFEFGDMGDILGDLFGMGGRQRSSRSSQRQGGDIQTEMTISFSEAAFGVEKDIHLSKDIVCKKCNGSGAEPGSKTVTCPTCKGTGQVVRNIGFGIGFPSPCQDCEGTGKKAEKQCSECKGRGVTKQTETISVKIPAGIDNNQSIRLTGRGQAGGKGGQAGDLYIKIRVTPDPRFSRQGYDILTTSEISFTQAALGGKIDIDTLDGKMELKIPEGTQSGKVLRLKGKGTQVLNSRNRGDQLITLIVKTPTRLNKKQKELLQELDN